MSHFLEVFIFRPSKILIALSLSICALLYGILYHINAYLAMLLQQNIKICNNIPS